MLIALVIFIIFINGPVEVDLTLTLLPLFALAMLSDRGQCVFSSAVACVVTAATPDGLT